MISYWSYWVHRVQELWRDHEELSKRVSELEKRLEKLEKGEGASTPERPQTRESAPVRIEKGEAEVLKALQSIGREATVEEINSRLKEMGIDESLKETLLKRLKTPVQKGIISYDPETKRFSL